MRIHTFSIPLLFLAGFSPLLHARDDAKSAAAAPAVQLVFELADGSRINGTTAIDRLKIKTQYATLNFELSKTLTIEFSGANHAAGVVIQNGDVLKGELVTGEFTLKTASGEVTVPVDKVNKILVRVGSVGGDFVNSLEMEFITVPGTKVLFGIWDTRVQDFEAFVTATGYDASGGMYSLGNDGSWGRHGATWKNPGFTQGATHPVVGVSWEDANAFCKWLTGKERQEGKIGPDQEYRLPADREWSVAVGLKGETGNTPGERNRNNGYVGVYPWGTQWPPPKGAGNYNPSLKVDDYKFTSPVGSFAANEYGLYDMVGNVMQWCQDWWDGAHDGRVVRGASWNFYGRYDLFSSRRGSLTPGWRDSYCGFRVVLAAVSSR